MQRRSFTRCQRGASAIEFAMVLPVFIVLLIGMICYGIYFGTTHSLEQLTADSARAAVAGLTNAERTAIATGHVATHGGSYPLLDATRLTVTAGPSAGNANEFAVTVTYDSSHLVIWAFSGLVPLPSPQIARTSTILRGGY